MPARKRKIGLHEQYSQIAVAALGYLAEDGAVAGRYLLGNKAEPVTEVAAFGEYLAGADRGDHRAGDDRADAGHCHQPLAGGILRGERVNLGGQAFDALVQPVPVAGQILDDP
jgi:hypothetical protein